MTGLSLREVRYVDLSYTRIEPVSVPITRWSEGTLSQTWQRAVTVVGVDGMGCEGCEVV